MNKGTLFVVSAPSGAGKTSLVHSLIAGLGNISVSISHTTRGQRTGEVDGKDYFFVDQVEFTELLNNGQFLEYAKVFDHYYGTAKSTVNSTLNQGRDLILEIDWQGALQVRQKISDVTSIFILPPSESALLQRLRGRGQDDENIIARRMHDARAEMSHYSEYDYLIVNDEFDTALAELKSIVIANRLETKNRESALVDLINELVPPPQG